MQLVSASRDSECVGWSRGAECARLRPSDASGPAAQRPERGATAAGPQPTLINHNQLKNYFDI